MVWYSHSSCGSTKPHIVKRRQYLRTGRKQVSVVPVSWQMSSGFHSKDRLAINALEMTPSIIRTREIPFLDSTFEILLLKSHGVCPKESLRRQSIKSTVPTTMYSEREQLTNRGIHRLKPVPLACSSSLIADYLVTFQAASTPTSQQQLPGKVPSIRQYAFCEQPKQTSLPDSTFSITFFPPFSLLPYVL